MLDCAAALLVLMLVAAPALGQAPLVVGSVRDQHGAAIVGAVVAGQSLQGSHPIATTDAAGTFALHAGGIIAVQITLPVLRERACRGQARPTGCGNRAAL